VRLADGAESWVLLSGILETAVEYGYLSVNPARGVKFPQKALKEKPAMEQVRPSNCLIRSVRD